MKPTPSVFVTLGIPTYNRLHYLRESVASARAQNYPRLEIVISQNPHPNPLIRDEIASYCRHVAASDSRIRYQLLPRDCGPPANFNAIADVASGEYLMMIGDDDRVLPDAIERLVSELGPESVLAFGKRYAIDETGQRQQCRLDGEPVWFELAQNKVPPGALTNAETWAWQQAVATETSLIRTHEFRRLRFRESVDQPDMEFFILLAREGGEFVFTPHYVTEYRFHADSTTGRGFVNYGELAELLAPLPVGPDVEPEKIKKLAYLTHLAVIRCILTGEVQEARRLLESKYFMERAIATRFCAFLPGSLASPVYAAYRWIRNRSRAIV
jgi:glycosyltransferase involved in cell wall biosynthesis